ncbi:hypothetical protein GUH10_12380, partial [Xanthomonas citri pv. citri]|nr:hypothetical protein [Xanthomonas citri pv. citri]
MKCCPLMLKRRSRLPVPSPSAGISGCCPFAWSRLKTAVRPVQPLETGMQMMRVADSRWPESLQQQQASTQWNEALKT